MIKYHNKKFNYQTKLYWYEEERKRLEKNVEEAQEKEKRTRAYLENKQVSHHFSTICAINYTKDYQLLNCVNNA